MFRVRLPLLGVILCAASGCASLESSPAETLAYASSAISKSAPQAAYDAGALALVRGDDAAARREWDRCLEISAADSPARLDCLVALEKLGVPSSMEP